jgi:hypothetical protein
MKNARFFLVCIALLLASGCGRSQPQGDVPVSPPAQAGADTIVHYSYEVVHAWPHDTTAFTETCWRARGSMGNPS